MKVVILIALIVAAAGCESPASDGEAAEEQERSRTEGGQEIEEVREVMEFPEIFTYGALRQINRYDDYSPVVTLEEARGEAPWPNHGVGALGGLRGEITLWGDELYLAHAGGSPEFEQVPFGEVDEALAATMFFAAIVDEWQAIEAMAVDELSTLERSLSSWRDDQGGEGAIPFRISDPAATVQFHVVDAEEIPDEGAGSCEERKEYGHQFEVNEGPVRLVGLFTTDHTGVVVDHRTALHVHAITEDGRSGHVDGLSLSDGAVIEVGRRR